MTPHSTGVAFAPSPADAPALNELPPPPAVREHVTLGPAMDAMFRQMCEMGASDLHISSLSAPLIRKDGEMCRLYDHEGTLSAEGAMRLLMEITPDKNRKEFEERHDTDFAYEIAGLARFRANIFMDRQGRGAVFRVIPTSILTAEQLGLSAPILQLCRLHKGLVLVTGPTGSGKSTTLCAMVDFI